MPKSPAATPSATPLSTSTSPTPSLPRDYRPEDFVIPARDAKGASTRVYCRVQPGIDRQMDLIFSSGRFPFKTRGDLHRWCLWYGVEALLSREGAVPSIQQQVTMMLEILRRELFNQDFLQFFDQATAVIQGYVGGHAPDEARRVALVLKTQIDQMPKEADPYWREKYATTWRERFLFLFPDGVPGEAGTGEEKPRGRVGKPIRKKATEAGSGKALTNGSGRVVEAETEGGIPGVLPPPPAVRPLISLVSISDDEEDEDAEG